MAWCTLLAFCDKPRKEKKTKTDFPPLLDSQDNSKNTVLARVTNMENVQSGATEPALLRDNGKLHTNKKVSRLKGQDKRQDWVRRILRCSLTSLVQFERLQIYHYSEDKNKWDTFFFCNLLMCKWHPFNTRCDGVRELCTRFLFKP